MKPSNSTKFFSHSDTLSEPNKYAILLKRLDEEEGLSEPSIEEKLKLAEDHLRLSCAKFCEAAGTLLGDKYYDVTDTLDITEPQTIQELFQAKCFEPNFRPPRTQLNTLNTRDQECILKSETYQTKKNPSERKKLQQAYYLPPSTWFSSEKPSTDLSSEEVELMSSCATKAFVRFLEEKKMEVPTIFSQMQSNHQNE